MTRRRTVHEPFIKEFKLYSPNDLSKKWFIYWRINGKRYCKYGNINRGKTYEERKKRADQLIKDLKKNLDHKYDDLLWAMQEWLFKKEKHWRKKSISTYQSILNEFKIFCANKRITKQLVDAFFEFKASKVNNTTYNKYRQKLKQMLKGVKAEHLIKSIESVKEEREPARYFQKHHISELQKEIKKQDEKLWLFVQFIFYCFIRPGELRFLKVEDIFFEEGKILIPASVSKNRKSQYVVIPDSFKTTIDSLRGGKGLIFHSHKGKNIPIGVNTMSTRHRRLLRKLGYSPKYKLYSWKHTGAVMAVKSGIYIKQLQLQLRHHSLDQVNEYIRQLGVMDMEEFKSKIPRIEDIK